MSGDRDEMSDTLRRVGVAGWLLFSVGTGAKFTDHKLIGGCYRWNGGAGCQKFGGLEILALPPAQEQSNYTRKPRNRNHNKMAKGSIPKRKSMHNICLKMLATSH